MKWIKHREDKPTFDTAYMQWLCQVQRRVEFRQVRCAMLTHVNKRTTTFYVLGAG